MLDSRRISGDMLEDLMMRLDWKPLYVLFFLKISLLHMLVSEDTCIWRYLLVGMLYFVKRHVSLETFYRVWLLRFTTRQIFTVLMTHALEHWLQLECSQSISEKVPRKTTFLLEARKAQNICTLKWDPKNLADFFCQVFFFCRILAQNKK